MRIALPKWQAIQKPSIREDGGMEVYYRRERMAFTS